MSPTVAILLPVSQASRGTCLRVKLARQRSSADGTNGHAIDDIELAKYPEQRTSFRALVRTAAPARLEKRQKLCDLIEADMKFSHSLQFNSVPDWSSHYLSYSNLKKLIYQLEKREHQTARPQSSGEDPEHSPLLSQGQSWRDPDGLFSRKLDEELEKICSFYQLKELEIYGEVDALLRDTEEFEAEHTAGEANGEGGLRRQNAWAKARQQSIFRNYQDRNKRRTSTISSRDVPAQEDEESDDEDTNEHAPLTKKSKPSTDIATTEPGSPVHMRASVDLRRPSTAFNDFGDDALQALYEEGITLKKRTINLYVSVCELRSFIQLNQTGFSKILKKYDKIMDRNLKDGWISKNVKPAHPFQQTTLAVLSDHLAQLEQAYATVVASGDLEAARKELRLHLREHVVWERNTVWREMIGIERKAQAANLGFKHTILGNESRHQNARLQGDAEEAKTQEVQTPLGRYSCPKFILDSTFWALIAIVVVFAVLLAVPIMKTAEQQNCLAMVVFVSLLWATEAIPLFVTSLLVPFLVVVLRVVREDDKPHRRLTSKEAAGYIFSAMWTPVIMLLLGGFTIAAALSKYNIAKKMATFVLSKAGTKPSNVLLASMGVALFMSMWISNVAAPVLCFSIIQVSCFVLSRTVLTPISRSCVTCLQTRQCQKHFSLVLLWHQIWAVLHRR